MLYTSWLFPQMALSFNTFSGCFEKKKKTEIKVQFPSYTVFVRQLYVEKWLTFSVKTAMIVAKSGCFQEMYIIFYFLKDYLQLS